MTAQPFSQTRALVIVAFFMGILLPPFAKAQPSATPPTDKTERQPIYGENADGEKLIAEATISFCHLVGDGCATLAHLTADGEAASLADRRESARQWATWATTMQITPARAASSFP